MATNQRSPVCTDVQRGAGFFNKIKILEESAKAIVPYFLTKLRDAHISYQIIDSPLKDNRDTQISCQIVDSGKSGAGKIRDGKDKE